MKTKLILLLLVTILSKGTISFANPPIEEGKAIFNSRCAACHTLNKVLTGPALAGVDERRSLDWIISFVHSSQSMVKNGDTAALAIFEKFNRVPMPDHTDLTEENIKNIVSYIKSAGKTAVDGAPFAKPGIQKTNYLPVGYGHFGMIAFLFVVLGLVMTLYYAVQLRTIQRARAGLKSQV